MNKTIVVLGGGVLQVPVISASLHLGFYTVVVDGNAHCIGREMADAFVHHDLRDVESIIEYIKQNCLHRNICLAVTAGTDFTVTMAAINSALGLPGLHDSEAARVTDKYIMRTHLKKSGFRVPDFYLIRKQVKTKIHNHFSNNMPIVLKPLNNMGGRGIRLIHNQQDLDRYIRSSRQYSTDGSVLLEERIIGEEYSIDTLVKFSRCTFRGIALRHISLAPYFIEMGHTIPAPRPRKYIAAIKRETKRAARSFAIGIGAMKLDMFFTSKPIIGELAARLSGGFMSGWTYPLSSRRNPACELLCALANINPRAVTMNLRARLHVAGERSVISIPGVIKDIVGIDEVRKVHGVSQVFSRKCPGDTVSFPKNNVEKSISVVIAAKNYSQLQTVAHTVYLHTYIRLHACRRETYDFLYTDTSADLPSAYAQVNARDPGILTAYIAGDKDQARQYTDWHGITLCEALTLLFREHSNAVPVINSRPQYRMLFWRAICKGGLQGGHFFFDTICEDSKWLIAQTSK